MEIGYPKAPLAAGSVSVRRWDEHDLAFLARASALETDPWSPLPCGRSEAQWREHLLAGEPNELTFIIDAGADSPEPADHSRAGLIVLGAFDRTHRVAELIGYWVRPELRGHGVGQAAIRLVSAWALGALGLARLQIFTRPDNHSSREAARRAGFQEEGVLRSFVEVAGERSDAVVLSLIAAG